ncbi:iron ABC transporter substrate-binding protein [Pseudomonas sp. MYb2]|jgi:iron complex transport system substrate-binding protein|uniref:ABC transporter substrate-binding protein n=1 Tax=unclassified Pseudomonas TaxID=196821 RepID=UPI000CFF705F|nr:MULTISPECIES: ABC transporter substrate-binding protein [unclassified Pseudomonas]PRB48691.1 iron ABC transporter substrate-binding protein [Pseudomonas sp. MYb3]PRC32881.1 iron ABC transporter substrate-binding protein [Pseudomonas sp. MYb2]
MSRLWLLLGALLCTTPALADTYRNCGEDWRAAAPSRIVALNQHAADLVLALGAGPALVGVAYLDDTDAGQLPSEYFGVPVIARQYPASEVLYAQRPDLVIGGFATAFGDGVTSRSGLARNGVGSYLLESACNGHSLDYFAHVRNDLLTLGKLLHRQQKAQALIESMAADLASARTLTGTGKPLSVFYLDSEVKGLDSEGQRGFVTPLLAAAGARNVFADIDLYRVTVNRETLLDSDPDVILLADAEWSPARRKRYLLTHDPVLSQLRAVREKRILEIPFTHLLPNFNSGRVALDLARQLNALKKNK